LISTEIAAVVRDETEEDEAYILMLVENLQREDLTSKEQAAALEVLVRERRWTTRQVGDAIKRSHMYVRRLRVFEDEVLVRPVLAEQLPVSTAEELLSAEPAARGDLVERAIAEHWGQADARQAILARNVPNTDGALQRRLKEPRTEVLAFEPESLSPTARAEARKLLKVLTRLVGTRSAPKA
jgi:ParB-like chromosome segregation protein Spo0J